VCGALLGVVITMVAEAASSLRNSELSVRPGNLPAHMSVHVIQTEKKHLTEGVMLRAGWSGRLVRGRTWELVAR
jgi:hypothetical protein